MSKLKKRYKLMRLLKRKPLLMLLLKPEQNRKLRLKLLLKPKPSKKLKHKPLKLPKLSPKQNLSRRLPKILNKQQKQFSLKNLNANVLENQEKP